MNGTVVVTGGSRGIGASVARGFAREGARVAVCSRDREAVEALVARIESHGGVATALRADVRDEFDVERFMEAAARFGDAGIDVVVANAGVSHGDHESPPIHRESYAAYDDHLRTNARGVFATLREALPHMTPEGRVLVTTGAAASDPAPGDGSYGVSLAAREAVAMAFSAAIDRPVGCVDPGRVATDLDGAGRADAHDPEDVAGQFVWAAQVAPDILDGRVLTRREWQASLA